MKTETLINALRILALEIHSDDGIANTVVMQAANKLEDLSKQHNELFNALENITITAEDYDNFGIGELIAEVKGDK